MCLRKDDGLTNKASLQPRDLQGNLAILYHPQRHPGAHQRLMELLSEVGIEVSDYSCASHPFEMQALVKESNGFALIGEGMTLDEELTTRPVAGVDWTVDSAMIYHKTVHPKTVPLLIRMLRRQHANQWIVDPVSRVAKPNHLPETRPASQVKSKPIQLDFFG